MKIHVLVVDDSAFMRKLITDFLSEDKRIEVIGVAKNGKEAIEKVRELDPDVITLDVEMPIMDGLTTLTHLMKENPKPVVMLSSSTKQGADAAFKAIERGAVDFVAKPSGDISLDLYKVKEELITKVISASKANLNPVIKRTLKYSHPIKRKQSMEQMLTNEKRRMYPLMNQIVCVGTSTGGPQALQEVITRLPKNLNAPVLVVQHMPSGFTYSLAKRLNSLSSITVKEAEDGENLEKGVVYIAKGGYHLKVVRNNEKIKIRLDQSTFANGHRPAVDPLFQSVATELPFFYKVAVIMTGMGSDGAKGLTELRKSGRLLGAIAESKTTSIIFSMPKAAIETGNVTDIVPLEKIADTIMEYIR